MARSSVTLKQYLAELRYNAGIAKQADFSRFPDGLLMKWVHKDIIEAIKKLEGIINHLYRATATIAVASAVGHYEATASHASGETSVTGFTGLTPDAWINGSILAVVSSVFYAAQITDNDATTITISVGTDLPVISSGAVILTANNAGASISLSSLSMLEFNIPIWELLDSSGEPIELMPLEQARKLSSISEYDSQVFAYRQGQSVQFALGSGASLSGNITVGYHELPTEATALTDSIDFPIEYHNLAQQETLVRIYKRMELDQKAAKEENEMDKNYAKILEMNLKAAAIDKRQEETL